MLPESESLVLSQFGSIHSGLRPIRWLLSYTVQVWITPRSYSMHQSFYYLYKLSGVAPFFTQLSCSQFFPGAKKCSQGVWWNQDLEPLLQLFGCGAFKQLVINLIPCGWKLFFQIPLHEWKSVFQWISNLLILFKCGSHIVQWASLR